MDDDSQLDGLGGGVKRACDQCRARKVRCDKESPCSNCRTAQRTCSSTGAGQKPKKAKQRVLISTQYERKIDHLDERLTSIETALQNISLKLDNLPPASAASSIPPSHHSFTPNSFTPNAFTPRGEGDGDGDGGDGSYDEDSVSLGTTVLQTPAQHLDASLCGNSILGQQTSFASDLVTHAVERTPLCADVSPSMHTALSSLRQLVRLQGREPNARLANAVAMPKGGLRELPMPPMDLAVSLLRELKDQQSVNFAVICSMLAVDNFTTHCRRVYFATEDFSETTFIIVNAGLYWMLQDKIMSTADTPTAAEYESHLKNCQTNLETALAHLPLLLPPRLESIQALVMGACHAVEVSRPSLAWQLNGMAAHLCQTLGYHSALTFRIPPHHNGQGEDDAGSRREDDARDMKMTLFWFAYMLDKGLSLRLGRPSAVVADHEITIPRRLPRRPAGTAPFQASELWHDTIDMWIRNAVLQRRIYAELYSGAALMRPQHERVASAHSILAELRAAEAETTARHAGLLGGEMAPSTVITAKSDEVSTLSSITLVYRAIPPPPGSATSFCFECIQSARRAIETHIESMQFIGGSQHITASYIHWTILYAPFIPFLILFCHIIETSDASDLRRLGDFVASMDAAAATSEGVDQLFRLSQVLLNVARLYVEAKTKAQPAGGEFDMYLSQLGLFGTAADNDEDMAMDQATQLGDWFSGNRYMMGLLEEDLSQFDPQMDMGDGATFRPM